MKTRIIFILFIIAFTAVGGFSQNADSTLAPKAPWHKNVIKFNPTPMLLWSVKNITFSYERVINRRQTFSIELGYLEFPRLNIDTLIHLVKIQTGSKWGFNATAEYRFYLTKLNTRPVPAGLYLAPYLTFYRYSFKNELEYLKSGSADSVAMLRGNYWVFNLGLELGYQFVFWKRLTLDMILIGPSVSYYGGKTEITGQFDPQQIKAINEELYNKLMEKFPGLGVVPIDATFKQSGTLNFISLGFRYLVQIGFHF